MPVVANIEITEEQLIRFEHGIPGFEQLKSFAVLPADDDGTFVHLQSVEEEEVMFLLADPFRFYPNYEFQITQHLQEELQIQEEKDVVVWTIVTVGEKLEDSTLNMLAPIVVNTRLRVGKQVILQETQYHTKHPLVQKSADSIHAKE